MALGLLGSASENTSTTITTNDNDNFSFNAVGSTGEGDTYNSNISGLTVGEGGQMSITQTDYGAMASANSIALAAFENLEENQRLNSQVALQAIDRSSALAQEAAKSEAGGAIEDIVRWAAYAGIGIAAMIMIPKVFK